MAKSRFRYLEDVATADAAFEAYGASLGELFANAAAAMFNVMAPLESIQPLQSRELTVMADGIEELLFSWLAELVYLKDIHSELYSDFEVAVDPASFTVSATVRGDSLDNLRSQTHTDVKAVTYHRLAITQTAEGFTATAVLDL
ncbi:MAG: archease [candidate division Zixibacteria bacterium]|nr:archease [candidate division Zixibacteria bacterium]